MTLPVKLVARPRRMVDIFSRIAKRHANKFGNYHAFLLTPRGAHFMEFEDFLEHAKNFQNMDDNILGLIVTIAWSMFFSRNEVRQGKPRQQNSPILHKA